MKISTKGRYALRMMIDLAEHYDEGYVTLKNIAKRQDISKKYLEQIVLLLNKDGILQSSRGFQGGYMLSRRPCEYTVGEILRITEGKLSCVTCLDSTNNVCPRADTCKTLPVWESLNRMVTVFFDSITLQNILNGDFPNF